jgi:hypothetical protein
VLGTDPLAAADRSAARCGFAADDGELLALLRRVAARGPPGTLMDQIRGRVHLGRHALLGSVASGIGAWPVPQPDVLAGRGCRSPTACWEPSTWTDWSTSPPPRSACPCTPDLLPRLHPAHPEGLHRLLHPLTVAGANLPG